MGDVYAFMRIHASTIGRGSYGAGRQGGHATPTMVGSLRSGAPEMVEMFLTPPGEGAVIDGKYRLVRPLARGGMGTVWVGRHIALDEPVAIKILTIPREEFEDADVRLQRQAKSAARLRSPHVVQL